MSDFVANLAAFCGLLRQNGVAVGPGESVDGLRALSHLDVGNRDAVFVGLRAALVKRAEDFPVYERAFRQFFDGAVAGITVPQGVQESSDDLDDEMGYEGGYSPRQALLAADLASLAADGADQAAIDRAAAWAARQLALKLSRRSRVSVGGARIDLRATVRRAMRQGGMATVLLHRRRRRKLGNLVLLLDVSGSMETYSHTLLRFADALQSGFRRAEVFCFATRLWRLERGRGETLLSVVRAQVNDRGGGTRIGEALTAFCEGWESSLLRRGSALVILSDGLDTGEPGLVAGAMERIRRRAGRVVWLNPLAGDQAYQPLARAMAAALPYVDVLAPAHSLGSLLELGRHLAAVHRR